MKKLLALATLSILLLSCQKNDEDGCLGCLEHVKQTILGTWIQHNNPEVRTFTEDGTLTVSSGATSTTYRYEIAAKFDEYLLRIYQTEALSAYNDYYILSITGDELSYISRYGGWIQLFHRQ